MSLKSKVNDGRDVERYIAAAPKEVQPALQALRSAIKRAAPKAEERIGYGIPGYYQDGPVIYFALWKKHIGVYPLHNECPAELEKYRSSKATARIPLDEKLPIAAIRKLVKERLKANAERKKNKTAKK